MIKKEVYDQLKKAFGKKSSWTVWADPDSGKPKSNVGDLKVFNDPNICDNLNNLYIFIGLNPAAHENPNPLNEDWGAFHSRDNQRQNDFKLRFALKDTKFWGSYMTDLFKEHVETDSRQVMSYLQEHPAERQKAIKDLKRELGIIGGKPTLVAMGNVAYSVLKSMSTNLGKDYPIIKICHYSYRISKEKYREKVLEVLNNSHLVL